MKSAIAEKKLKFFPSPPPFEFKDLFKLLKANRSLSNEEKDLISNALKSNPELTAYFLYQCIFLLPTEKINAILNQLIDLKVFNEITINQTYTQTMDGKQQTYSVSYLLLFNLEAREILKKNTALCDLIGEKLSVELLKQFVSKDTHDGTLYYLLSDPVGQEILKNHASLQEKINNIDQSDKILSTKIVDGPLKGQFFRDFYTLIFPNLSHKTISLSLKK